MIGIWICKCFSFMQDNLSLDTVVELCGLHVNSLSRTVLLPSSAPLVSYVSDESDKKKGLPDVIGSNWQSRSPPGRRSRSSFPSYLTLQQGSYQCNGLPHIPSCLSRCSRLQSP